MGESRHPCRTPTVVQNQSPPMLPHCTSFAPPRSAIKEDLYNLFAILIQYTFEDIHTKIVRAVVKYLIDLNLKHI